MILPCDREVEGDKSMNEADSDKEQIFELVQEFLQDPPVIIWGSGATIPYGLPSMNDLKEKLGPNLIKLDENTNLETELGKVKEPNKIDEIRNIIRNEVLKKDRACLGKAVQDINHFHAIRKMINKFCAAHPRKVSVITTNYDCVLEYAISREGYNYTDGFRGKPLSTFDKNSFRSSNFINLIKVHGSLNWITYDSSDPFFMPYEYKADELKYAMILPGKNKYQEAFQEPYRTLIAKSDEYIDTARSFLVVGFGFNDEHLTPKLENRIQREVPIVIITKKATESCMSKLNNSSKYCLLEQSTNGTKVTFRKPSTHKKTAQLEDDYWKLEKFMGILGS